MIASLVVLVIFLLICGFVLTEEHRDTLAAERRKRVRLAADYYRACADLERAEHERDTARRMVHPATRAVVPDDARELYAAPEVPRAES